MIVDLEKIRKQNFSCIYKIQSKKTRKCYIGSAKHFGIRRRNHLFQLENKKHHSKILQNHVNKYGIDDIFFEILILCDFDKSIVEKEQYFIDLFTPYFNVLRIAHSTVGRIVSEETRKKLVMSHLGKKQSEETKEKRKKSLKITFANLSEQKKKNRLNHAINKRKKVICNETGVVYNSITEAELLTGCRNLTSICKKDKRHLSSKGLTFNYYEL